jgi:hypothetical protein
MIYVTQRSQCVARVPRVVATGVAQRLREEEFEKQILKILHKKNLRIAEVGLRMGILNSKPKQG